MSVLPPKFRSIPALSRLKVYIILHRCFYNGKHSVTIYLLAGSTVKLQDCFHNFCTRLPPNVSSLGCIKAMYSFSSSPLSYRIIVRIAFVYTKVNPKFLYSYLCSSVVAASVVAEGTPGSSYTITGIPFSTVL